MRHGAPRTPHPTCQLEAEQHVILRPAASCERTVTSTARTSAAQPHESPHVFSDGCVHDKPGILLTAAHGETYFYSKAPSAVRPSGSTAALRCRLDLTQAAESSQAAGEEFEPVL